MTTTDVWYLEYTHCFNRYPSSVQTFSHTFCWQAWVNKACVLIEEMLLRHRLEWFRPIGLADSRPGLITGLVSPYGAAPPNHAFWTCSAHPGLNRSWIQASGMPGTFFARHVFSENEVKWQNDVNFRENERNFMQKWLKKTKFPRLPRHIRCQAIFLEACGQHFIWTSMFWTKLGHSLITVL